MYECHQLNNGTYTVIAPENPLRDLSFCFANFSLTVSLSLCVVFRIVFMFESLQRQMKRSGTTVGNRGGSVASSSSET